MATLSGERADILETLRAHRGFLRYTARDLNDEQAARQTTVSALTIGGIIKHVSLVEAQWVRFIVQGPSVMKFDDMPADAWVNTMRMVEGETLAGLLRSYEEVARKTDELVETVDLDSSHPLPEAPWFPKGATRSARRVLLHIVAETSQHAGHADIIREALDGAKTMA